MTGLNGNHKSHLRITFTHVDELLFEAVRDLDPALAESPFCRLRPDATPVQRKVMADYAARVRRLMRTLLDRAEIPLPPPTTSAIWAARTVLTTAEVAILELEPTRMLGYGPLPEQTAVELRSMIAELTDLLRRMDAYLAQGATQDLQARLARLEGTSVIIEMLKVLEQIITTHGWVEFRPTLETLIERVQSPAVEVGVFGRVKTGKSSLLNYVLQTDCLPTGVTPITAVPTRIHYGLKPLGTIWFAEDPAATIELERLAEFATEQQNPSNRKHVTRIQVDLPSALLKPGIIFVDTPGIGSLATSGAAESMAYLPRCDVGIVLIDSAAAPGPEDLILLDLLHRSGADVLVLLSRADILTPPDRPAAVRYAREQVKTHLGIDIPVYAVSTQGAESELCDRWLTEVWVPLMQDHQHLAEVSLRRKVERLRAAVQSALQRQLPVAGETVIAGRRSEPGVTVDEVLSTALGEFKRVRLERINVLGTATELADLVVEDVAQLVASHSHANSTPPDGIAGCLREAIDRRSAQFAARVHRSLTDLRETLLTALNTAATQSGLPPIDAADVPTPADLPVIDSRSAAVEPLKLSTGFKWLGERFLRRSVRKQLQGSFQSDLRNAFARYGQRLEQWRQSTLSKLYATYTANSDFILAPAHGEHAPRNEIPKDRDALSRDLAALRRFDSEDPSGSDKLGVPADKP